MEFLEGLAISGVLFGSVAYFWLSILALVLIIGISDWNESGWIAAVGSVIFVGVHWKQGTSIFEVLSWQNILIYLGIGIVYSFVRTYFSARKRKEEYKALLEKDAKDDKDTPYRAKNQLDRWLADLKFDAMRWLALWPVSIPLWFLKDMLADIIEAIYDKLAGVYRRVFEYALR